MLTPRRLALLLLCGTVLVWGATFTLVKSAIADISPLLFNFLRMSLASLVLVLVNWRALRSLTLPQAGAGGLAGLFLAAGYQFQTLGLAHTTPAHSAFLTGLVVVFVPALSLVPSIRPKEVPRPGLPALAGALLAFTGVVYLTVPAGTAIHQLLQTMQLGDLLSLVCALAFAAHLLTLAHFAKGIAPGVLATLQIAACTAFMLATLPAERSSVHFTAHVLLALAVCSVFATAAAFTIQSFAQQHLAPAHTVLVLALEPVFAAFTSFLFEHERFGPRSMLGAGLILTGILAVDFLPGQQSTEIPA